MANEELSDDCKQRLRDLDRGLAQVIECLTENDLPRSALLSRQLLALMDQSSEPDEPCKRALRSIDQTSFVLLLTARLDQTSGIPDGVIRLVDEFSGSRQQIQAILLLGSEPEETGR